MRNNKYNLLLENGYNTSYIYSLIISLFYLPSDSLNKLLNNDSINSNTYYIQEYIKAKLIYPIQRNNSISSDVINKFRNYLFMCGWMKESKNILENKNIKNFYVFMISKMMNYNIKFLRVPSENNYNDDKLIDSSYDKNIDIITIDDSIIDKLTSKQKKIVTINEVINIWLNENISENEKYSYKFNEIPLLIPIYIDYNKNRILLDILNNVVFENINDKFQKSLSWDFHSMICQDKENNYYSIINHNNNWLIFSDNIIPSVQFVEMNNIYDVKKIIYDCKFIFYKYQ